MGFGKLRMVFTISFFVMVFSHFHFCRVYGFWWVLKFGLRPNKSHLVFRWLEFKELFGPDFKGAIQTTAA